MLEPDAQSLLREVTWLRRLALRLVADSASADDLAGDALAALAAAPTPPQSPRGWLATVLRRRAGRAQQRDQLRQRSERLAARTEALPAVDDSIAKAQLHRDVVDAVLALREPYRSAIVLRFLDDLPLAAVAVRLQVPVETARTRIKRGLDQLRWRLDQRYGDRRTWTALLPALSTSAAELPLLTLLMGTKSLLATATIVTAAALYLLLPEAAAPEALPVVSAATANAPAATAAEVPAALPDRQLAAAPEAAGLDATPTAVAVGRVVDEATLLPLPGVTVAWLHLDLGGNSAANATSGVDGRFRLATSAAKPQDRLVLLLRERDHALTTKALGSPTGDGAPLAFDVGDVPMPPGTAVAGRVVDQHGAPAADTPLLVCLFSYWTQDGRLVRLQQAQPVGRTGPDGSFRLDDRLLPNRPPPLLLAAGSRGVGFVDLADLRRDRSEVRADIRLLPLATLAVNVVDERGDAVKGALVVAEPRFLPLGGPGTYPVPVETVPQLAEAFTARTGSDGCAELQPLALSGDSSQYTLRVEAVGRDRNVVPVTLPHAGTVQVVLPKARPLRLHGTVCDAAGRPIPGARVAAHWQQLVESESGGDGRFALAVARGEGPLQLQVRARHWFPARQQLQPDAATSELAVAFTLRPATELSGRVVDQEGRAVAGADVWLAGGDPQSVPTRADGSFAMPVPPAVASTLHVQPPQPASSWAGSIDHLLAPGQTAVTLVVHRLPAGRADLEVELLDAQGRALEARTVALVRQGDGDGLWHPATATIGRITASDLAPGDWTLGIEPTSGCEFNAAFAVPPGGDSVRLHLVQPLAARAHGEVVCDGGAPPERLELAFPAGSQQARFAAKAGQELLAGGRQLGLDPRGDWHFAVVDVDPSRPLAVVATAAGQQGEAAAQVAPGGDAALRLRLQAEAALQLRSAAPFESDRLQLQLRRPGGSWGEWLRFEGLSGRTELLSLPVAAGAFEWRVRLPSRGADNFGAAAWQQGRCDAAPGAVVSIALAPQ